MPGYVELNITKGMVDGDIRRCPDPAQPKGRGRCGADYATVTLKAVREMRPARTEIYRLHRAEDPGRRPNWGDIVSGLFHDRRQKG